MQGHHTTTAPLLPETPETRHNGTLLAVVGGITLLSSLFFPALSIFLGVLLILAVALHAWAPDLRPYVRQLLRMPVTLPGERHKRLSIVAGAGVLLVVSGAAGATIRGQVFSQWEQREQRREAAEAGLTDLLQRAEGLLASGDVEGAEFILLDAEAASAVDGVKQDEVDELLERVRRSGDS